MLQVVPGELDRLVADGGVSDRELTGAKGHLTGSLALSLESSSSRMHRIGRSELTMGEIPSLDWVVEQVEAVTPDDVSRVIGRVLGPPTARWRSSARWIPVPSPDPRRYPAHMITVAQ